MKTPVRMATAVMLITLQACSPALNWRQVQPEGAGLVLTFPCKPETERRSQPGPQGQPVDVALASCKAGDWQFSLAWVDLGDPAAVTPALQRMHDGLAVPLQAGASAPLALPGMTPHPLAQHQAFAGRAGQPAQQVRQALFARGTRVYQLLMQGPRANDEAWDGFRASVALTP